MAEKRKPREFWLIGEDDRRRNVIDPVAVWRRPVNDEYKLHMQSGGYEVIPVREVMPEEDGDASST